MSRTPAYLKRSFLSVIVFASIAGALIGSTNAAALYSSAHIDNNLRSGINSAIGWDMCRHALDRNGGLRAEINAKCSYADETWLSGRGTPKAVLPVDVTAGTTSAPLQINSVVFLAGSLVEPNVHTSVGPMVDDWSRWVTNPSDANDRRPNPVGNSGQLPARIGTASRIVSLNVISGNGSVSTESVGSSFIIGRDDNSRYWFAAPKSTTYSNTAGIQDGDVVIVRMEYQVVNAYQQRTGVDSVCTAPGGGVRSTRTPSPNYSFIDTCAVFATDLRIEFNIPYSYTLTPSITNVTDDSVVTQESTRAIQGHVNNSGPTVSHDTIEWQVSRATFAPNATPNKLAGYSDPSTPFCSWSQISNRRTCDVIGSAGGRTFSVGGVNLPIANSTIGSPEIGTRVCYVVSVKRHSSTEPGGLNWRHSTMRCMVVGKYPSVQITGSDLITGRLVAGGSGTPTGAIDTSTTRRSDRTYGSWGEYAILPRGMVIGMASAAGYASGISATELCSVSHLTFANRPSATGSCDPDRTGGYTMSRVAKSVSERFPVSSTTTRLSGNNNLSSLTPGRVYTATDGSAIGLFASADIAPGQWYVINAPRSTVTITANIRYSNGRLTSLSDIPQVVIIAQNIIVSSDVAQIDAWLVAVASGGVATGRLNTCGAGEGITEATQPTSAQCNRTLRINGPVAVNRLLLKRTAGAEGATGADTPAEIFNLRPDAYLWASNVQSGTAKARTVMTKELPPRY